MKRLLRTFAVFAIAGFLCLMLLSITEHHASASGGAPVYVQNTPLPVQGTISLGNTPSVSVSNFPATQQVTGTVDIGNLPSVQTAATVVNFPGTLPFSMALTSSAPQFAVPTTVNGQSVGSLVVTEVGGFCTGIGSINLGLQDVVSGNAVTTFRFPIGSLQFGVFPMSTQQTKIFVGAGHSVAIDDTTPPHGCHMDLSGYYVTQ